MSGQPVVIVGFVGLAGAGKDYTARILRDMAPRGAVHLAFADAIRDIGAGAFGLTHEEMTDRRLKETPLERWDGLTPRKILQLIGTEVGRAIHPDVWVRALQRKVEVAAPGTLITVTDVRFPNEVATIRKMGGWVVFVDDGRTIAGDPHPSERMAAEWAVLGPPLFTVRYLNRKEGWGASRAAVKESMGAIIEQFGGWAVDG